MNSEPGPRRPLGQATLFVVFGALAIAAGAQLSIPMVPVPTTLQTLAIAWLGLVLGGRLAGYAGLLYLLLVLADLPVLSSGQRHGGLAFFEFLAFGYVLAFVPGAMVAGWLGYKRRFLRMLVAAMAAHVLILFIGASVLGYWLGWSEVWSQGVAPFLLGAVAKSLLAALLAVAWRAAAARRRMPQACD
jgi:biotin transport system substrate-specific component